MSQRSIVRILRRVCLAAAIGLAPFVLSGCGASSPVEPSASAAGGVATAEGFIVPGVLTKSIALIDSDAGVIPLIGQPTGVWLRSTVRGVVIDPSLPHEVRAQCCDRNGFIHWSTGWLPDPSDADDVRIAAAIIVHEARHAEGYVHTCPDGRRDRSFEEGGAWAVHAEWLRRMGDIRTADSITMRDIGCG